MRAVSTVAQAPRGGLQQGAQGAAAAVRRQRRRQQRPPRQQQQQGPTCAAVAGAGKLYIDPVEQQAAAFAPATVANLGPGFDWMGCAVEVSDVTRCFFLSFFLSFLLHAATTVGVQPGVQAEWPAAQLASLPHQSRAEACVALCPSLAPPGLEPPTPTHPPHLPKHRTLQGDGDVVVARVLPGRPGEVVIEAIEGDGGRLSLEAPKNCVGIAAIETLKLLGAQPSCGVGLTLHKGLPLGSGLGSSAASAAASAVAVNALFGSPLPKPTLVYAGLASEAAVSGYHADNIAPALLGGFVLIRSCDPLDLQLLPFAGDLWFVLVNPRFEAPTAEMRAVLPKEIPMKQVGGGWGWPGVAGGEGEASEGGLCGAAVVLLLLPKQPPMKQVGGWVGGAVCGVLAGHGVWGMRSSGRVSCDDMLPPRPGNLSRKRAGKPA